MALTWMLKTEGMVRTFATKTCLSGCVQIRHVLMIPYASHAPEPELVAGQHIIVASIPDVWPCLARNQVNVLAESGKLPQSNSGRTCRIGSRIDSFIARNKRSKLNFVMCFWYLRMGDALFVFVCGLTYKTVA